MHLSGEDLTPINSSLPPIPSPGRKTQTDLDDGAISKKTLRISHLTRLLNVLLTHNLCLTSKGLHKNISNARSFCSTFLSITEVVAWRGSVKKVFLEILQNSQESTCARVSFLLKLQAEACNFIKKETLTQVFCCEFSKFLRTTFLKEHLRCMLLEVGMNTEIYGQFRGSCS